MVTKCANPECATPLQYLRDGKVYRVEVREVQTRAIVNGKLPPKKPMSRVEHFWLCGQCSQTMSIEFDEEQHVSVVPKERRMARYAVAAAS